MDVLQGALAFAVAMIVFSTVVTGIVEVILRGLRIRPLLLIRAMEHYVEQYLQREMQRRGMSAADETEFRKLKAHIVGALVGNPAKAKVPSVDASGAATGADRIGRFSAVEDLSTYAFLQRFAKTEAGQKLAAHYREAKADGHERLQSFLQDALRTFERYMATVNERFRIRSQRYAMIIALLVAFGFNISAGRLFTQLTTDTPLQQRLILDAEQYANENFQAVAELNAQLNAAPVQGEDTQDVSADSSAASPVSEETVEDLLARTNDLQERSRELLFQSGLPVGPGYFPYNLTCTEWRGMIVSGASPSPAAAEETTGQDDGSPDIFSRFCDGLASFAGTATSPDDARAQARGSADPGSAALDATEPTRGNFLMWFINVVIAGFLIGLGGPFWYRVYSSLSSVAQVVRMLGGGNGRPEVLTDKSAKLPATHAGIVEATDDKQPGDLVSVFLTAVGPPGAEPASPTVTKPGPPQQGTADRDGTDMPA